MLFIVLLFDWFLLRNIKNRSIFILLGILFILMISVKYIVGLKDEIYSLSLNEAELIIRFYFKSKCFATSDIEKIYRVSEHNISFNRRYGVVKAMIIIIKGKSYIVTEQYQDYDLFENYVCSKFEVCDINNDNDISI